MPEPADLNDLLAQQREAKAALDGAQASLEAVNDRIAIALADRIDAAYRDAGKDHGQLTLAEGGVRATVRVERSVSYDQEALKAIAREHWADVKEALVPRFNVLESRLADLPDEVRAKIHAAGTVRVGHPKIALDREAS